MSKPAILVCCPVFPEVIDRLSQHFDVTHNQADETWSREQLLDKIKGKVGAFTTGSQRIDADLLEAAPTLRICANMAVGYNNFDVPAMSARKVLATNTPDVLSETTADMGFALLMAAARRVAESEHFLRAGKWNSWRYDMFAGAEVHGSTMGILGMGRIGRAIAKRGAMGFGMNLIYHNRSRLSPELEAECGARYVSKEQLLRESDHLVLVLPYSPEAHHIIGAAELAQMKPTATLVNIARGGLIDENALVEALRAKRIAAAGLDVFEGEPKVNPALLTVPNVVLTPHIGSATVKTRLAMANLAADNLISFLTQGKPLTPLNPEVLG